MIALVLEVESHKEVQICHFKIYAGDVVQSHLVHIRFLKNVHANYKRYHCRRLVNEF